MIVTELYNGQGLGNQLWCYVTTRVIATDRGLSFGIQGRERFKGVGFMDLDFGEAVRGGSGPEGGPPTELPEGITRYYSERAIIHPKNGSDIRTYDRALVHIADGTKIDGCMQDEEYIAHRKDDIRKWLALKPDPTLSEFSSDDVCIINFRGSGYVKDRFFFLPPRYWRDAMRHMRTINPRFRFVVVTEDVETARVFFPELEVHHWDIGTDYAVIAGAHYVILSNSSFAWFPTWLNTDLKLCIAPRYWGRHTVSNGYWSLGYNITRGWSYLNRDGRLQTYEECRAELDAFAAANPSLYDGSLAYVPGLAQTVSAWRQILEIYIHESGIVVGICRTFALALRPQSVAIRKRILRLTRTPV